LFFLKVLKLKKTGYKLQIMKKTNEASIQQQCVMYFNNTFCLKHHTPRNMIFSIPNEGQDSREQNRKKQVGLLPGASDTIIVMPNRVIFCEFKDEKGKQSDKQIDFQNRVNALGFEYWIVRSLEEFQQHLSK